jgi:Short-chain dehydrogenases of various substrate specificities|nr:SDR family NAD(P)-dependent oxidoreductase [uncultured Steroidobacter sp.]
MSANPTDVQRPLALVTGASTGIGFELARKLAERGYDLMMVAEDAEKLNEAADLVSEIDDLTQVEVVQADLSQREGVRKVYDSVRALHRPVELLAANAGVGVYGGFSDETDLEEEIALINLNVTSQVHLIKLISRDMLERGGGDILITSSVAGVLPGPRMAVYAASKAFLRSFGQAIRNELEDKGVNVTVLMPGPTDTEFFERAHMEDTVVGESAKQDPAEVAEAAIQALNEHADHVVPGVKNKMQVSAAKLMSDETRARVHGKQTERKH